MLRIIKSFLFATSKKILGSSLTRALHRIHKKSFIRTQKDDIQIIEKVLDFVTPGSLIIDVGANIGDWTIPLSKKTGEKGQVIAFEPNKETVSVLKQRTKRLKNVKIKPLGLSDRDDQLELLVPNEVSCPPTAAIANTANHLNAKEHMGKTLIQVRKLDQIVNELELKDITFVKIDVEGHELNVLKGFHKGIVKDTPTIFMEILKSKWVNNSPIQSECARYLTGLGYEMFQYDAETKKFEDKEKFNAQNVNFLFLPRTV